MDKDQFLQKVNEAVEIANAVDERWRPIVFRVALERLLAAEQPAPAHAPTAPSRPEVAPQLNEFLASLALRSHTDTVEAMLYHALHHGATDRLTANEIAEAYAQTRRPRPRNLSDVVGDCIRRGHVIDAPERKGGRRSWQITPSGERYVEGLRAEG